jgi:hypothetical protein
MALRVGTVLVCLGAAFLLDDPAEESIGHLPTSLQMRRVLRIVIALPLLTAWWAIALKLAGDVPVALGGPMPAGDVTLEAAGLVLVALACASLASRFSPDRTGGIAGAPSVLVLAAVAMLLPPDKRLIVGAISDAHWHGAHEAWRWVLVVAGLTLAWTSRDPGRYSLSWRLRRSGATLRPILAAPAEPGSATRGTSGKQGRK